MESRATLATRNPCLLASTRVKVGLSTARLPGFQRRMRSTRFVATGAFERARSVSVEINLSCEPDDGGAGAIPCGDRWRKKALPRIYGFEDFGVTTLAMRAFKNEFSSIEGFIGEDHEDGDDEEEEGRGGGGRGSDDDDDDEEDTTDDEDEEEDTTDEEDTTEDEDEDEDEDDQEDEGECDD